MKQYQDLLHHIMEHGNIKNDRTGTGTKSVFGYTMRFNLQDGFPLLTTKKMFTKGIIHELLWFLSGDTNIKYLLDNNVHIWDNDAYRFYLENCDKLELIPRSKDEFLECVMDEKSNEYFAFGELGNVYGHEWRRWGKDNIDQITNVINTIKTNPDSRRMIVTAWNPDNVDNVALPPCHVLFQFYVCDGKLSCHLYQRSADVFLGVPFNIASYSLLIMMIAQVCGLEAYEFVHTLGDAHLYLNHMDQVNEQLSRTPKKLPTMKLNPNVDNIFDFKYEDFQLVDYEPYPTIKAEMSF